MAQSGAPTAFLESGLTFAGGAWRRGLQFGESLVLAGVDPSPLLFPRLGERSVILRSRYGPADPGCLRYEEGRDFVVDSELGHLRRTDFSRIPDYSSHPLFAAMDFDHRRVAAYGNVPYQVFVDYRFRPSSPFPAGVCPSPRRLGPPDGREAAVLIFGDSIAAGYEASVPERSFARLWEASLRSAFPSNDWTFENRSLPGARSTAALSDFIASVEELRPSICLIAFGMNDQNRSQTGGPETSPDVFVATHAAMAAAARRVRPEVQLVLVSPAMPNPRWTFGTNASLEYRMGLAALAEELGCCYADVTAWWKAILERKRPEDVLANNVNHPNDFSHGIYAAAISAATLS